MGRAGQGRERGRTEEGGAERRGAGGLGRAGLCGARQGRDTCLICCTGRATHGRGRYEVN